ncbi:beta-ketoacyl synthase [Collimonas humicola]|uniref:beta-ketoacyl synthase n=1 Tax=Collimonas humicola TaxID=2825886 RepID=UPI001B8B43A0|nr:beta-ketoacyl synthase [Collimonas humicola]
MERVVITGIGVVGPHGTGLEPIFNHPGDLALPFAPWPEAIDPPHRQARIAQVTDYPVKRFFTERQIRLMDRAMALSSTAAGLAIENAGLSDAERLEACTFLGTARAELPSCYQFIQPQLGQQKTQLNAADFPKIARNVACGQVAIRYRMQGPSTVLASGSLASVEALARAAHYIRVGRSKVALVGGYESLSKFSLYFLRRLYASHLAAGKPQFFGTQPGYLVPSEGSCMLVLESASHAEARGAAAYCSVDAWDAGRFGADFSAGQALEDSWARALARAGNTPASLGLISAASGGANRTHELAERSALNAFFGKNPGAAAQVHTPRSLVGEGESWASALQVAMAAFILKHGRSPATRNVAEDVPAQFHKRLHDDDISHRSALVSGVGSGGNFCSIHLSRP